MFQLPSEVLEDEEEALDKASFIIECLTLYRLLLLKKEDKVPSLRDSRLMNDRSEVSCSDYSNTKLFSSALMEGSGKVA